MPSKLVKANQDKESNPPTLSICPLFQVSNYEHIHTHIGTHTHTQEHSYRNTHTSGWGRAAITEGPEEQDLGL